MVKADEGLDISPSGLLIDILREPLEGGPLPALVDPLASSRSHARPRSAASGSMCVALPRSLRVARILRARSAPRRVPVGVLVPRIDADGVRIFADCCRG